MIAVLVQDGRYGLRQLLRNPGFTLAAVLTLALGIGANTAIFRIVNGLLLRPLPVADAGRLVALFPTDRRSGETRALSYPEYLDYRDRSGVFAGLAAQQGIPIGLGGAGRAEVVWGEIVSENYFTVLGLAPALGRTFTDLDDFGPGSDPLVVLSHRLWQRRFGGDGGVIGRQVILNGHEFTVVGIAPAGFTGTRKFGFWPDVLGPDDDARPGSGWKRRAAGRPEPGLVAVVREAPGAGRSSRRGGSGVAPLRRASRVNFPTSTATAAPAFWRQETDSTTPMVPRRGSYS